MIVLLKSCPEPNPEIKSASLFIQSTGIAEYITSDING